MVAATTRVATGVKGAASGGSFSIYIGQPENPLIPGNTNETEGGQVIDSLFTGLVQYDPKTNEADFTGVAESIESEDQTTWTVTLNDGWTFHDGTPVTAKSFVDAWNYTAYSPNAQGNSYFFATVAGYDQLQAPTDGEAPAATEMSRPARRRRPDLRGRADVAVRPVAHQVGYTAFFPLPEAFFDDPEAFGKQPIGNGPFKADEEFVDDQGITLTQYEDYAGDEPANADEVKYVVYAEQDTAYTDLQGGNDRHHGHPAAGRHRLGAGRVRGPLHRDRSG